MKTIYVQIICRLLPTNLLLKATNNPNFSDHQIGIIGEALCKRFGTQEELEQTCEVVFGRKNELCISTLKG